MAEYGLSMLIEKEDGTLFDTGQGLAIINNLKALGREPENIRRAVISHGHYDHTGGLIPFLKYRNAETPVYVHETAFNEKYALLQTPEGNSLLDIGMQSSREEYEKAGARFMTVSGFAPIAPGITSISSVFRQPGWKSWDRQLKQKVAGEITDDPFDDDMSLLIDTDSGPVVLLGCAHAGIVEILNDISRLTGHLEFHAVMGGTHLGSAPEDYVNRAIETIRHYRVKKLAVSHCTGFRVAARFAAEFRREFEPATTGTVFEF
jgi:7,8-dihydropterin-6-yl-methyl-4-(beta-D-ribofuranosyl)aminobenzene 5'-phosphate synthase